MKASDTVISLILFSLVATGGIYFLSGVYAQYGETYTSPSGNNFSYIEPINETVQDMYSGSKNTQMELGMIGWISGGLETLKKIFDVLPFFTGMVGDLASILIGPLGIPNGSIIQFAIVSIVTIVLSAIVLRSVFKYDV